jgi:hypothetical protein
MVAVSFRGLTWLVQCRLVSSGQTALCGRFRLKVYHLVPSFPAACPLLARGFAFLRLGAARLAVSS